MKLTKLILISSIASIIAAVAIASGANAQETLSTNNIKQYSIGSRIEFDGEGTSFVTGKIGLRSRFSIRSMDSQPAGKNFNPFDPFDIFSPIPRDASHHEVCKQGYVFSLSSKCIQH